MLIFIVLVPGSDARPAKKIGWSVKLYVFQHCPSSVENLKTSRHTQSYMTATTNYILSKHAIQLHLTGQVIVLLYGADLSVSMRLHCHYQASRVQDVIVVRSSQSPQPGVTSVPRHVHIWPGSRNEVSYTACSKL